MIAVKVNRFFQDAHHGGGILLSQLCDQLRGMDRLDLYSHVLDEVLAYPYKIAEDMDLVITLCDINEGRPSFGLSKGGGEIRRRCDWVLDRSRLKPSLF